MTASIGNTEEPEYLGDGPASPASMAHAIRNPLDTAANLLYLLAASPQFPFSLRGQLNQASVELSRAVQMAEQMLSVHCEAKEPLEKGCGSHPERAPIIERSEVA